MSNIKENDLTMTEKDLTIKKQPIVEQMEKEWPEMTGEFKRLQREQYELFCRKQHDYGPGNISVGTQLQTEADVKLSLTGLWFRMNDKIQRLKESKNTGTVPAGILTPEMEQELETLPEVTAQPQESLMSRPETPAANTESLMAAPVGEEV